MFGSFSGKSFTICSALRHQEEYYVGGGGSYFWGAVLIFLGRLFLEGMFSPEFFFTWNVFVSSFCLVFLINLLYFSSTFALKCLETNNNDKSVVENIGTRMVLFFLHFLKLISIVFCCIPTVSGISPLTNVQVFNTPIFGNGSAKKISAFQRIFTGTLEFGLLPN